MPVLRLMVILATAAAVTTCRVEGSGGRRSRWMEVAGGWRNRPKAVKGPA